jgi:hypothetical protein
MPDEDTWADNRDVTCAASNPKGPMTGSVRG